MGWFSKCYPLVRFDACVGQTDPHTVLKLYNKKSPAPVTPMKFTYKVSPRRPMRCGVLLDSRRSACKVAQFLKRSRDFAYRMTDDLARNSIDIVHWLNEDGIDR